jgi:hypothetical protein
MASQAFKHFITAVLLGHGLSAAAQYSDNISSDRPGMSNAATTVGARVLQLQTGGEYAESSNSEWKNGVAGGTGEVLIRYGIWERFELGFSVNPAIIGPKRNELNINATSTAQFVLRARSNILAAQGFRPALGMQMEVVLPDSKTEKYTDYIYPRFTLMVAQKLAERLTLSSNLGGSWAGTPQGFYTFNLNVAVSNRVSMFIEHFGLFSTRYTNGFYTNSTEESRLAWYSRVIGGLAILVHKDVLSWRIRFKQREKKVEAASDAVPTN